MNTRNRISTVLTFAAAAMTSLAVMTTSAQADYIVAPGDPLIPAGLVGDSFQLVFVTSSKVTADSLDGTVDTVDNTVVGDWNGYVNTVAGSSTLTGIPALNWSAIVSVRDLSNQNDPGVAAKDNALVSAPVFRTDGAPVATGFADMWDSSILNPLQIDESGNLVNLQGGSGAGRLVWTGSNGDGTIDFRPLGNPGSNTGNFGSRTGNAPDTDDNWINRSDAERRQPNTNLRVYGLSETITVVSPTAPEPSTLILAALGFVGLMGTRRRRRNRG